MKVLTYLIRRAKKVRYGLRKDDFNYIDYLPFWRLTLREKNYLYHLRDFFLDRKRYKVQKKVFRIWADQYKERDKPVYWAGWLYQSLESMHLFGWRNSEERISIYGLDQYLKSSDRVLDIGANLGCIPLILHKSCRQWVCLEPNRYLMEIHKVVSEGMQISNIDFVPEGFEEFESPEKFDVIFSFASHSTYDGNTKLSPPEFFNKVAGLLKDEGLFFFESHNGEMDELDKYEKIKKLISDKFEVVKNFSFISPELTLSNQSNGVHRDFIIGKKIKI